LEGERFRNLRGNLYFKERIRNQWVVGSNPTVGSTDFNNLRVSRLIEPLYPSTQSTTALAAGECSLLRMSPVWAQQEVPQACLWGSIFYNFSIEQESRAE